MNKKKINITHLRNVIVLAISVLYLAICIWSIATTKSWVNRSFPGFLLIKHNYVSTLYLSGWEGYRRNIRNLDKVIEVNGKPVSAPMEVYDTVGGMSPGTVVNYTIRRGDRLLKFDIPVSTFTIRDYIFCFPVAMLLGLFFCASGLVFFYLKPESPASWHLLLSFVSMAILFGANGERCTNGINFLPNIFTPLVGPPMLLYSFYFPVVLKHRRPLSAIVISIMLFTSASYTYGFLTDRGFLLFDRIFLLCMLISVILSTAIQVYSYTFASDQIMRQRAKVAIYAFVLTFLFATLLYYFAILPRRNNFFYTSIPSGIMPFVLGYAIVKHNLFDVDIVIQRSMTYVILSALAVAVFFGLGTLFSLTLQGLTGQSSQASAVISTLIVVLLFNPLKTRIDRIIDKRFFREKYEYTDTIRKASKILAGIIDLDQLLLQLLDTVMDAMKIGNGLILLKYADGDEFRVTSSIGYEESRQIYPVSANHPYIRKLDEGKKAVQKNDVQEFPEFEGQRDEHLKAMDNFRIVLAVPIMYEGRLTGIFGLGEKKSGAWYSNEDMELLTTLMIQTAVSIENARKIEELKKMVELETSFRELKKLDEMKDHFLSMVSHDLRTPMTSIRGYASLINSKAGKLTEEREKHFSSIIIKESERLTRLINDLLDLQRFEAGKMYLQIKEVNLVEILKAAADSFRGAVITKRIEFDEDISLTPILIDADPDRLSQVISNLLSNAVKFTPEEGKVRLTMEIVGENGEQWARVTVADNGPGIPKDQQEKLFSKFQQVQGQDTSKERGSGLGLALVKEIINYHNGTVGMESEPGKGSAFYFKLRIKKMGETSNAEKNPDSR